jgi:hypothetical protein
LVVRRMRPRIRDGGFLSRAGKSGRLTRRTSADCRMISGAADGRAAVR